MKAVEIVVTKVLPRQPPTMEKVVLRDGRTTWVKASAVNKLAKAGMILHLACPLLEARISQSGFIPINVERQI